MSLLVLIINSVLLGVGLAVDAFSVSVSDGLGEPDMRWSRVFLIAGTFSLFQGVMPFAGWILVHFAEQRFEILQKIVPWVAAALLVFLGVKMIIEGVRSKGSEESGKNVHLTFGMLMVQGVATSIDALSVGLAIAEYSITETLQSAFIIAAVTLVICISGLKLGARLEAVLKGKAPVLGGIILIAIALEIVIKVIYTSR
ncbi:MAG: manganese efflux pump MntP family protein [Saccharofermentans sp.]|nr:manganese efflux pump MntP family protein [Saccharofermentans sp.]